MVSATVKVSDSGNSYLPKRRKQLKPDTLPASVPASTTSGSSMANDSPSGGHKPPSPKPLPVLTITVPDSGTATGSTTKKRKRPSLEEQALLTVANAPSSTGPRKSLLPRSLCDSPVLSNKVNNPPYIDLPNDPPNYKPRKNPISSPFPEHKLDTKIAHDRVFHGGTAFYGINFLRRKNRREEWKNMRLVGFGSYGAVHLQKKQGTNEVRAVKEVSKGNREWPRELYNLISLKDRSDLFVEFRGWYEDHSHVFYIMEYLEHGDLEKYIETSPEQAAQNAREISKQILEGLVILHNRNICHRDLKPQNVLIDSLSPIHIKLTDFGASKCENDSTLRTDVGTMAYIAPEILAPKSEGPTTRRRYTKMVDMWSFGCLVYFMLTGERLFTIDRRLCLLDFCRGKTEIVDTILEDHIKDLDALDFVHKLLIKDGSKRMSATEALGHKWITSANLSEPSFTFPSPTMGTSSKNVNHRPWWRLTRKG